MTFAKMSFEVFASETEGAIDVPLGAALIAKDVYVDLDVDALLGRLAELVGPLRAALVGQPLDAQVRAVSERFRELGFRGNTEDYYDAKNSLLPDVLDRRIGIPITLALVWCEIARRAGVYARGIAFPGHFLVRVDELPELSGRKWEGPVIVDPFTGGGIVGDSELRRLLRRAQGPGAELHAELFEAATSRSTLVRMLTNLKAIWVQRGDLTRAFLSVDRIVTLLPDSAEMLRERAAIALRLGLADLARRDFVRALELEPDAADASILERRVAALGRSLKSAPN